MLQQIQLVFKQVLKEAALVAELVVVELAVAQIMNFIINAMKYNQKESIIL